MDAPTNVNTNTIKYNKFAILGFSLASIQIIINIFLYLKGYLNINNVAEYANGFSVLSLTLWLLINLLAIILCIIGIIKILSNINKGLIMSLFGLGISTITFAWSLILLIIFVAIFGFVKNMGGGPI